MAYKSRPEPKELLILRLLNARMSLSEKDKQYYFTLNKGYEGELVFDEHTEKLQCECYILNGLLLQVNNTTFQIDALIVFSGQICHFEIKNFEGDFFIDPETNNFFKKPKKEYSNPLLQSRRSDSLLRQLLQNIGYNYPTDAKVVYINPEFTLFQAPLDDPIILPTQINSLMKKLNATPSKLTEQDKILADKLISLHLEENPYSKLPKYDYKQLRKGQTCENCNSFSVSVHGKHCVCGDCGHEELVTAAVLRSVKEVKFLFPGMKITTNIIFDWCQIIEHKRTIRKVLVRNYKQIGVHQWTYYE